MKLLKQNPVKYGLVMTAISALTLLTMQLSGQYQNSFPGQSPAEMFIITVIPAVVWYLGISAKKKSQKNKLTFKQGLMEGIKISAVYGFTSSLVYGAFYLLINPEVINLVRDAYGLTSSSFLTVVSADMTAQILFALIFGTIYSAVISFFLKSKS